MEFSNGGDILFQSGLKMVFHMADDIVHNGLDKFIFGREKLIDGFLADEQGFGDVLNGEVAYAVLHQGGFSLR